MLIILHGKNGSGKTLFLVLLSLFSNRKTYANFHIKTPKIKQSSVKLLEVIDLLKLKNNANLFIDEGYTWLESRTSMASLNRYLSYIKFQSRKRDIDIYLTCQLLSSIDIRFRESADVLIYCEKLKNENKEILGFLYTFLYSANEKTNQYFLSYSFAKSLFVFYDSYEIIEPEYKQNLEYNLISQSAFQLNKKIKKIVKIINPQLKNQKITKYLISKILLENNISKKYMIDVYNYLKQKESE